MAIEGAKSKIITVSFKISTILEDSAFFNIPGEVSDPETIKNKILQKYKTDYGILQGFIDENRIVLQWYPDKVLDDAEKLNIEATELSKQKKYEMAILKLRKAISLNDIDIDYFYKLGLIYFETKNFKESIEFLEKVIAICPIHFRANLLLGIDWIKLRKFENAEKYVLDSYRLNPTNMMTLLNLGAIFSIQKRFNEAIDMFNSAIQLSPNETRAYLGLARIYNMLNDLEASNSYFKKVIELAPGTQMAEYAKRAITVPDEPNRERMSSNDNDSDHFSKGLDYYLSGNFVQSAKKYKDYLQNHPSDDYAWYLFGESKIRTGELDEAVDSFKRAIRLNSKRGLYYKSLGIALHFQSKSKEVIEVIKKAIEMGKKDSLCLALQGIHLLRLQKITDAVHTLQSALKKNPNNPTALYHLALAHLKTDEVDKAVKILTDISKFEYFIPLKEQAKNLLRKIH